MYICLCSIHPYLFYPGGLGPDTVHNFEMSVTPSYILSIGKGQGSAIWCHRFHTNGEIVVIFPLKLTNSVPGRPKCS